MAKKKVHLFNNPRNGANTCVRLVDPDERHRWGAYIWKWDEKKSQGPVTCLHCRRYWEFWFKGLEK